MTSDLELHPAQTLSPLPSASDLEQTWQLASRIAKTEFVPANLRNKPEAVLAVFLTGRELGIGPMQSLRDIYPVNGRPAMMANLMVSRVRAFGHRFRTISSTDTEATVQIHRRGERDPEPPLTFTLDDARRARLDGKDIWRQYPKAMLWNRAASAACRRDASEALGAAVYTPEELDELPPVATTVQVGPAEIDSATGEVLAERTQEADLWADDMPTDWAIDNIRDAEDAKWLLQQPEISDDYREAVKAVVGPDRWAEFWRSAPLNQWRLTLAEAMQLSGAGSKAKAVGDAAADSPAPAQDAPTPTPGEGSRAGVEGANQPKPGDGGTPPPSDAAAPPGATVDPSPRSAVPRGPNSPAGDAKGKRAAGRADPDAAEQAAFEQKLAADDPGKWTR